MSIEGLERLEVWKRAKAFAVAVCRDILPVLPVEEKWVMNQQLRRAAQSIPANIAEGYGRFYYQENIRFCYNARGSLEETLSHLSLARDLDYIPAPLYLRFCQDGDNFVRLINGYIAYLKRSRVGENEQGSQLGVHEEPELYDGEPTEDDAHEP